MSIATPSTFVNDEDPYEITSALEIQRLLRSVEARRALLRMHLKGRAVAVVTTILEVDTDNNRLIVDVSSEADVNERLASAEQITFDTMLDKIHIQFSTTDATHCQHDNLPALSVLIPHALTRIQRREFYRVDVPVTNPASCKLGIRNDSDSAGAVLSVKDISAGGVSIIDPDLILNATKGILYRECRLDLPEAGVITSDLRVMRFLQETLADGTQRRVVGCKFVNLPNAMQIVVQHYIGMLERNENAKRRGFA